MKQNLLRKVLSSACLTLLIGATWSSQAFATNYYQSRTYKVTVTNVSRGVQFTPILAATHNSSVGYFELGQAPSNAIGALAEGGDVQPLKDILDSLTNQVSATTVTEGLLQPGASVEFEITASFRTRYLSMAAMLLPTNDSMMALDTVALPSWGSRTYHAKGYDAGSEENDELCANIPGPACGGDGKFVSVDDGGEGYVHISGGIHGEADLSRKAYDWRNPVAAVTVKRVR